MCVDTQQRIEPLLVLLLYMSSKQLLSLVGWTLDTDDNLDSMSTYRPILSSLKSGSRPLPAATIKYSQGTVAKISTQNQNLIYSLAI
jgi:hypothetical protein